MNNPEMYQTKMMKRALEFLESKGNRFKVFEGGDCRSEQAIWEVEHPGLGTMMEAVVETIGKRLTGEEVKGVVFVLYDIVGGSWPYEEPDYVEFHRTTAIPEAAVELVLRGERLALERQVSDMLFDKQLREEKELFENE